jgi:hypothetical protein
MRTIAIAALITTLGWLALRWLPAFSRKVIGQFHVLADHVPLFVVAAMILPLGARLALLPVLPSPEPYIHDEFSHLLVADTLTAGRLANPPHPLWRHLETIYVLQRPTYSSIYPIGQGVILAVGKVLTGNAWAGVLLAVALMCGAITWMLYGCLPPQWAAIGGFLAAFRFGLAEPWVNSYYGGAFCAFGGALLFGALCRLQRSPSLAMASLAGLGWSIVWLTRPFESLLLLMIFWGFIAAVLVRDRRFLRRWLIPILLILLIQISTACVTAFHNRAVTGSVTRTPYLLSQRTYGVPQTLLWQPPIQEPPLQFAELKASYKWQRSAKDWTNVHVLLGLRHNCFWAWRFFIGPWYSLPIALLVFLLKDWRVIASSGIMFGAVTTTALYPFFFPHYIAAYTCVICFLIVKGFTVLHELHVRRHLGSLTVLFLISVASMRSIAWIPFHGSPGLLRAQIAQRLLHLGRQHVVFVRYDANHSFHDEWVYNSANIDASPIVWCRAIDPADDFEVTRYYKNRQIWIADVGAGMVRLSPYQPGTPTSTTKGIAQESKVFVLRSQP